MNPLPTTKVLQAWRLTLIVGLTVAPLELSIVTASAEVGAVVEVAAAPSSYQLPAVSQAVDEVLCHVRVFAAPQAVVAIIARQKTAPIATKPRRAGEEAPRSCSCSSRCWGRNWSASRFRWASRD